MMEKQALYTLILEYNGGTYLMQSYANSPEEAPKACISNWDIDDIEDEISETDRQKILKVLAGDELVPVSGLKEVWNTNVILRNELIMMTLVKTV